MRTDGKGTWGSKELWSALLGLVLLAAPPAAQAQQPSPRSVRSQEDLRADFETRWKAADGPQGLRELEAWCGKNKLAAERMQVSRFLAGLGTPDRPAADAVTREQARAARDQSRKAVRDFLSTRRDLAQAELGKLLDWMKSQQFAPPEMKTRILRMVGELVGPDPDPDSLSAAISRLEHAPASPEDEKKLAKELSTRIAALEKPILDRLFMAVDRCLAAGEPGLAFDLYQLLLRMDPENERARRGLGETKVGGTWLRPFDVDQVKAGLVRDERLGWIIAKDMAKYDKGDCYDFEAKRWAKLTELNSLHAQPGSPWKLRSEHFDLISTADLELSVQVQGRLEAFFLQVFRQYDLFFAGKGTAALIFGMAPAKKRLTVYFYRDHDQFLKEAKPPFTWAAGFYTNAKHASFFHGDAAAFHVSTLQHELTHQILAEYTGGAGNPPQWLAEGAAVYLEDAFFQNGTLTLGTLVNHSRIEAYRNALRSGQKEHSLRDVLRFVTIKDWDSGDIPMNYRGVGAVLYFFTTLDGGRYRGDAIAMLRDAYSGNLRPIEDYFGLSIQALDLLMTRFYKDCEPSSPTSTARVGDR